MLLRRVFAIWLALIVGGAVLEAQTPTAVSSQKFAWDQAAPTLADAQNYAYRYYADGSSTAQTFGGATCAGSVSPFQCEAPIPAFTPGTHSITLTASNVAGESAKSSPFGFVFVVVPGAPTNIRIK